MAEALLDQMARTSRARAAATLAAADRASWRARALAAPPVPQLKLRGFELIAECKLRAPSSGRLAQHTTPEQLVARAQAYASAGACAISVLTEPERFDGELAHLAAIAPAVRVPAMRKDFLVDPVQVHEARLTGAGGVLLIARMLEGRALRQMLDAAAECGMFALLECFDADDAHRAAAALVGRSNVLIGVNTRDLKTLEVRPGRLAELSMQLPRGVPWVAESGMATPDDVAHAASLGYQLALVGTALMQAPDPAALVRAMRDAGESA